MPHTTKDAGCPADGAPALRVTRTSPLTGIVHTIAIPNVTAEQVAEVERTGSLRSVHHLSASHREFIRSGIPEAEWDDATAPPDATLDDFDDDVARYEGWKKRRAVKVPRS